MKTQKIRPGLQAKFILLSTALLLTLTVTLTWLNIRNQQRTIEQRMFDKAQAMASLLAETVWDGLATLNIRQLKFALDDALLQQEVVYVYVFDAKGRVLTDGTSENPFRNEIMQDPVSTRATATPKQLLQLEPDVLDATRPIYRGREKMGGIRIGFSLERMRREVRAVRNRNILLGGFFLLIGVVLTSLLVRKVTHPLSKLIEATELVSKGNLDGDVVVRTHDELQILAQSFNRMVKDLKQSRDALVQEKERAEEMARLKSAFLTNMSHEFRTPLTGILGCVQVLIGEVPKEHLEFVHIIEESGQRLLRTLSAVLELSELESDKMSFNRVEVDLAQAVEEAARLCRPVAEQKGLLLHLEDVASTVTASLDRAALHRILYNLIDNAVKFTDEGAITVAIYEAEQHACVAVRDTGRGISDAFLPHLFDDFKQESSGYSRTHEGNGLGLSITKRLVDLMEGEIEVTSEPGEGSTFTVRFLLDAPGSTPVSEAKQPRASAAGSARPLSIPNEIPNETS